MKTRVMRKLLRSLSAVVVITVICAPTAIAKPASKSAATAKADVAISMADSPDPADIWETVTYAIQVSNGGPSTGKGISVKDVYPAAAEVVSASSSRGSCSIAAEVTCSVGTIASGETVRIVVQIRTGTPGTLLNQVSVRGTQEDPDPSNNSASTSTEIQCLRCPTVKISDTPDPAKAGEVVMYSIEGDFRGQTGSALERGSRVIMRLPDSTEYLASAIQFVGGSCSYSDRTVTCDGSTRPNVNIAVRVLQAGALTATVDMFIRGNAEPNASATTITSVGPARAPMADRPVQIFDQAESGREAIAAEAERVEEEALQLLNEVLQSAPTLPVSWDDVMRQLDELRRQLPFFQDCILHQMQPCLSVWDVFNFVEATVVPLLPPLPPLP